MNVSRSTVSNWEAGRRLPDVVTLMKLSSVLNFKIDVDEVPAESKPSEVEPAEGNAKDSEPVVTPGEMPAEEKTEEPRSPAPVTGGTETEADKRLKPAIKGRKWLLTVAAALVLILLAVLIPTLGNRTVITPYKAVDGKEYRPEDFQRKAEDVEGEPYLKTIATLSTISSEEQRLIQYEFTFHETNGCAFTIDRAEIVVFGNRGKNQPYVCGKEELEKWGLGTTIEPRGEWSISGGLPEQDAAVGAGILMTGQDSNGKEIQFTGYLAF